MPSCLTLIAAEPDLLTQAHLDAARMSLATCGADFGLPDWLEEGRAVDLPYVGPVPEAVIGPARQALAGMPVDLVAQKVEGRRKQLLLADMDSTIVTSETLDELAAFCGLKDKVAAITARAMNGEIDFHDALRERVAMLEGLPVSALEEAYQDVELTGGAEVLVRTMRQNGAHCVLVSGGFKFFTSRVAARCGFHEDRANDFIIEGRRLTGEVVEPILDKHTKLETLNHETARLGIEARLALTVGDGANDLPMLMAAGLGIAFHAKPVVAASANHRLDHADLTGLLYAQGYHRDEFVTA